jgi:membrane-bound lytic murein transglycosylase A
LEIAALKNKNISSPECQITKWDLLFALKTEDTKNSPVLVQTIPVTFCEKDLSCLHGRTYDNEQDEITDKKALLKSINQS